MRLYWAVRAGCDTLKSATRRGWALARRITPLPVPRGHRFRQRVLAEAQGLCVYGEDIENRAGDNDRLWTARRVDRSGREPERCANTRLAGYAMGPRWNLRLPEW